MDVKELWSVFEALLFVADEPLEINRIQKVVEEIDPNIPVSVEFDHFVHAWNARESGIVIIQVAGGYQFRSNPSMDEWIRRYKLKIRSVRLSRAALETIAIVAYRQPISTPEIEAIRSVNSSGVIKSLLEKDLIAIIGRKDIPGRPIMYATTKRFLEEFGLNDLSDLPKLREVEFIMQNKDVVESNEVTREGASNDAPIP